MKLAELCTAFPETAGTRDVRDPGSALPRALRFKLRAQRGHLQSALDTHPQRSPNRLGLGLRPYESGDSLRALALRPLLLQEQMLTRTDVSPGRFHVCVIVHAYANMNFKSSPERPSKHQMAWALAGMVQNLHEQQAQKVDFLVVNEENLPEQLIFHAARIRRSHFCYVISDLLFDPSSHFAATRNMTAAIQHLRLQHGMFIIVRDIFESPKYAEISNEQVLAFQPPDWNKTSPNSTELSEKQSGAGYVSNLKAQMTDLQNQLNEFDWSAFLASSEDEIDQITHGLTLRLAGQRKSR